MAICRLTWRFLGQILLILEHSTPSITNEGSSFLYTWDRYVPEMWFAKHSLFKSLAMLPKPSCHSRRLFSSTKNKTQGTLAEVEKGREPGSHLLFLVRWFPKMSLPSSERRNQNCKSFYVTPSKSKGVWFSVQFQKLTKSLYFCIM
jgi:hypothetical protein